MRRAVGINIRGSGERTTGESKTGGANKRGGATMAIYVPSARNRPPHSAVLWIVCLPAGTIIHLLLMGKADATPLRVRQIGPANRLRPVHRRRYKHLSHHRPSPSRLC